MLTGENTSPNLCVFLTSVTLEKAHYTFGPATKHLDSIDCSVRWGRGALPIGSRRAKEDRHHCQLVSEADRESC
jgi:hypothetical protein